MTELMTRQLMQHSATMRGAVDTAAEALIGLDVIDRERLSAAIGELDTISASITAIQRLLVTAAAAAECA